MSRKRPADLAFYRYAPSEEVVVWAIEKLVNVLERHCDQDPYYTIIMKNDAAALMALLDMTMRTAMEQFSEQESEDESLVFCEETFALGYRRIN